METKMIPAWHYICMKVLVLVTTINLPNFMLVSESAQFTWNFELCRRTMIIFVCNLVHAYKFHGYLKTVR